MLKKLQVTIKKQLSNSLMRNAYFLMASTALMSVGGFLFWIIAAKLFSSKDVGLATVLISITSFLTTIGLLGLENGLLRFLSKAEDQSQKVSASVYLTCSATIAATAVFIAVSSHLSAQLSFVKNSYTAIIIVLLGLVVMVLDALFSNILVAYRSAQYILLKNAVYSLFKLVLPFAAVSLGAIGIFLANSAALLLGVLFSAWVLWRRFNLRPALKRTLHSLTEMRHYAATQYVAALSSTFTSAALPVVILNQLGPVSSAYYYIATMLTKLLSIIPQAMGQSLLAEGAHDETKLFENTIKAGKHILLVLAPAILCFVLFGRFILRIFGGEYAAHATLLLVLLSVSALFGAVNYLGDSVLNIQRRNKLFLAINTFNTGLIFVSSVVAVHWGLTGLGYAWLGSQIATVALYAVIFRKTLVRVMRQS